MRAETAHAVLLLVVLAGLGLACFAAAETAIPSLRSACSVNLFLSCSRVDSSAHTTTLGVPDWALGVGGFVVLLALEIPLFVTWRRDLLTAFVVVSGLGVLLSLYLGYVELAIIGALCPVCFSTYVMDAVAFLVSLWLFLQGKSTGAAEGKDEGAGASPAEGPEPASG